MLLYERRTPLISSMLTFIQQNSQEDKLCVTVVHNSAVHKSNLHCLLCFLCLKFWCSSIWSLIIVIWIQYYFKCWIGRAKTPFDFGKAVLRHVGLSHMKNATGSESDVFTTTGKCSDISEQASGWILQEAGRYVRLWSGNLVFVDSTSTLCCFLLRVC